MSKGQLHFAARLLCFSVVGLSCLALQILVLQSLKPFMLPVAANAVGFAVSAQLNFLMSYHFTWRDSTRMSGFLLVKVWLNFNCTVLVALCVNSVCFLVSKHEFKASDVAAALIATATSTIGTFLVNHLLVLKPKGYVTEYEPRDSYVPTRLE